MTVTTEMTFTSGVASTNFNAIKDELKGAIAAALSCPDCPAFDSSMIELTHKESIQQLDPAITITVVVTITSMDEGFVIGILNAMKLTSFVSTVNTEISNSVTLSSIGVALDSATDPKTEGFPGEQY